MADRSTSISAANKLPLGGTETAFPMALTLASLDLAALATFLMLARGATRGKEFEAPSPEVLVASVE
jgi:hypothetical protein